MMFSSRYQIEIPNVDVLTYLLSMFLLAMLVTLGRVPVDAVHRIVGYPK